jgi:hypothetical protein|tara:strand:- start:168 stop:299 length:132 start_codon:yes stop_codon:yes gene_type:complete
LKREEVIKIKSLWKCGKPLSPPVEKALKNKKHFSTFLPQVPKA